MAIRSTLLSTLVILLPAFPVTAGTVDGVVLPFRQVEVSAPVSSRIEQVKVAEGDSVQEGQPLAILYGRLEELEMQRAKALLERRDYEAKGAKRLYDNRIIPEAKALESKIEQDLARLQYEAAAEQVRLRTILAPITGVVVSRAHESGEAVSTAQPLFRIMDLSKVLVQCGVDPKALATLATGQKVRVRLPQLSDAAETEGEVLFIAPCADATGKVRVKVVVDNAKGRIRAGLKAQVVLPDATGTAQ
jgi:RND family efflux transporter MFP subunit